MSYVCVRVCVPSASLGQLRYSAWCTDLPAGNIFATAYHICSAKIIVNIQIFFNYRWCCYCWNMSTIYTTSFIYVSKATFTFKTLLSHVVCRRLFPSPVFQKCLALFTITWKFLVYEDLSNTRISAYPIVCVFLFKMYNLEVFKCL